MGASVRSSDERPNKCKNHSFPTSSHSPISPLTPPPASAIPPPAPTGFPVETTPLLMRELLKNATTSAATEVGAKTDELSVTPDHTRPPFGSELACHSALRPHLTSDEVADLLRVHPNTVVNLTKRGVLRRAKLEGCSAVRYSAAEVARYMNELQSGGGK